MAGELMENWRPVCGYDGIYEVSDCGQVRSLGRNRRGKLGAPTRVSARILKQGGGRYSMVLLCRDGERRAHSVHRLVAEAFIPRDETRLEVNHRDGDKRNNHVSNLEWVTRSENVAHAYQTVGRRGWKRAA